MLGWLAVLAALQATEATPAARLTVGQGGELLDPAGEVWRGRGVNWGKRVNWQGNIQLYNESDPAVMVELLGARANHVRLGISVVLRPWLLLSYLEDQHDQSNSAGLVLLAGGGADYEHRLLQPGPLHRVHRARLAGVHRPGGGLGDWGRALDHHYHEEQCEE